MAIKKLNVVDQTIYDQSGMPGAYLSSKVIYAFNGHPIGYVDTELVWTFRGMPAGWMNDGWLRSLHGSCIGFTRFAQSAPAHRAPITRDPPKTQKRRLPAVGARKAAPHKPAFKSTWSYTPLSTFLEWVRYQAGE